MDKLDVVVIGGGVIGMAVARRLALAGREVVLLEAESSLGAHTSSRNSEVIHAGIYYEPGSLKAQLCVAGKHALYDYCSERGVPHRRVGKLIVGHRHQREVLEKLEAQAASNGVHDLEWVDQKTLRELEPAVVAEMALWSPSTGILDSHEFLMSLKREAIEAGAVVAHSSPVLGGAITDRGVSLRIGGAEPTEVECRHLVNAAGLFAPAVARGIAGIPADTIPPAHLAKGHYFTLTGPAPFRHLIYPIPEPGGLGVHVTLDLAGVARF
ncbi:MAG TPA: FAD-dependent oxidoreductase, partial [Polyangiaceae bacterium]|nr:FAD-dependent oxidoreductase [Polyangiaceae bacterium]